MGVRIKNPDGYGHFGSNNDAFDEKNSDASLSVEQKNALDAANTTEDEHTALQEETGSYETNKDVAFLGTEVELTVLKNDLLFAEQYGLDETSGRRDYEGPFRQICKDIKKIMNNNRGEKSIAKKHKATLENHITHIKKLDKNMRKGRVEDRDDLPDLQKLFWNDLKHISHRVTGTMQQQDPFENKNTINKQAKAVKKANKYLNSMLEAKGKLAAEKLEYEELLLFKQWLDSEGYKKGPYRVTNSQAFNNLIATYPWLKDFDYVYSNKPFREVEKEQKKREKEANKEHKTLSHNEQMALANAYGSCKTRGGSGIDYTKKHADVRDALKTSPMDARNYGIDKGMQEGMLTGTGANILKKAPNFIEGVAKLASAGIFVVNAIKALWHFTFGDTEKGKDALKNAAISGGVLFALTGVNRKNIRQSGMGVLFDDANPDGVNTYNEQAPDEIKQELYYPINTMKILGDVPNSVLRHHVTYDANGKIETVDYDAIKEYVTQHVKDPSKTTALENLGLMRALKTSDGTDAIVASLNASGMTKEVLEDIKNAGKSFADYFSNKRQEFTSDKEKEQVLQYKKLQRRTKLLAGGIIGSKQEQLIEAASDMFNDGMEDVHFFLKQGEVSIGSVSHNQKTVIDTKTMQLISKNEAGQETRFPASGSVGDYKALVRLAYQESMIKNMFAGKAVKTEKPFGRRSSVFGGDVEFQDDSLVWYDPTSYFGDEALDAGAIWSDAKKWAPQINTDMMINAYATHLNSLDMRLPAGVEPQLDENGNYIPTGVEKEIRDISQRLAGYGIEGTIGSTRNASVRQKLTTLYALPGVASYEHPSSQETLQALKLVEQELKKRPPSLLKAKPLKNLFIAKEFDFIDLTEVGVGENRSHKKIDEQGLYNRVSQSIILETKEQFDPKDFAERLHHEMMHHIVDMYDDSDIAQNQRKLFHMTGIAHGSPKDLSNYEGFASPYGTTSIQEDMSTVMQALMNGGTLKVSGPEVNIFAKAAYEQTLKHKGANTLTQKIEYLTGCTLDLTGSTVRFVDSPAPAMMIKKRTGEQGSPVGASYRNNLIGSVSTRGYVPQTISTQSQTAQNTNTNTNTNTDTNTNSDQSFSP